MPKVATDVDIQTPSGELIQSAITTACQLGERQTSKTMVHIIDTVYRQTSLFILRSFRTVLRLAVMCSNKLAALLRVFCSANRSL